MKAVIANQRYPFSPDFDLEIGRRAIPGWVPHDQSGENPDIDQNSDPEDVWEEGGVYEWSANGVADIVSLSSSDNADTQLIRIDGLGVDGKFATQFIQLQGRTRVALTTPLWRVYSMENDDTTDISGSVYCYAGTQASNGVPSGSSVVKAKIINGNNKSLMAIFTVPLGYVGMLVRGELGFSRSSSNGEVEGVYYSRRYGKVFKARKRVNLVNGGSSIYQDRRSFPDVIPALTDLKLSVKLVSANNAGVFGTLDILLIPETDFPSETLTLIEQPTST